MKIINASRTNDSSHMRRSQLYLNNYNDAASLSLIFQKNMFSSTFSSNSEVSASELLENLEEMFPQYYMGSDVMSRFKSSTMHWCVVTKELRTRSKLFIILIQLIQQNK